MKKYDIDMDQINNRRWSILAFCIERLLKDKSVHENSKVSSYEKDGRLVIEVGEK